MVLYVLMKDGKPFQLPAERGTETDNALQFAGATKARYATASTVKEHVEAMQKVLPDLLDMDFIPGSLTIAEYTCP